eukprot:363132-Chlamydomonas_euryale.AAC.29
MRFHKPEPEKSDPAYVTDGPYTCGLITTCAGGGIQSRLLKEGYQSSPTSCLVLAAPMAEHKQAPTLMNQKLWSVKSWARRSRLPHQLD